MDGKQLRLQIFQIRNDLINIVVVFFIVQSQLQESILSLENIISATKIVYEAIFSAQTSLESKYFLFEFKEESSLGLIASEGKFLPPTVLALHSSEFIDERRGRRRGGGVEIDIGRDVAHLGRVRPDVADALVSAVEHRIDAECVLLVETNGVRVRARHHRVKVAHYGSVLCQCDKIFSDVQAAVFRTNR